ncbi:MAG: hypothetical protein M0P39_14560 [Rhodocyclaceae bacterium]|jgi:hypothetical protein|nr:hypothetical protein [Rhodocyclaceae bacterium]
MHNLSNYVRKDLRILIRVLPLILVILVIKLGLHFANLELLSINAIFSGLIGANVFLMGFLLSGVLADYRESERIPGEVAATLLTIADEFQINHQRKPCRQTANALNHIRDVGLTIYEWLHKREKSSVVMDRLSQLNRDFYALEPMTQINAITRLKQEQNALRKLLIRIHTIRETNFISSGYFIAATATVLLLIGLTFARIEPFYESLFFVFVVSYLLLYLLFLIRDLDNPFGYYELSSSEDVSLKPLDDALRDLGKRASDGIALLDSGITPIQST